MIKALSEAAARIPQGPGLTAGGAAYLLLTLLLRLLDAPWPEIHRGAHFAFNVAVGAIGFAAGVVMTAVERRRATRSLTPETTKP